MLFSLSAICRACRGSLTEEAKPHPPEDSATASSRETRHTLPRKVYVQEESASPSSEESNETVSNYIVNKNSLAVLRCFCFKTIGYPAISFSIEIVLLLLVRLRIRNTGIMKRQSHRASFTATRVSNELQANRL